MTPAEIEAMIEIFQLLEPPVQKAFADLISKVHHKTLTAEDYLALAAQIVPQTN
jgi:hypothetical protein